MDRAYEPFGSVLTRAKASKPRLSKARPRRDLELEAGARAHFDDPTYYAASYASRRDDVAYYVALARGHRAVLEYGIGNGRIAIPVARTGVDVIGIDHSRPMLDDLRVRLAGEPVDVRRRVTGRLGDMRVARISRKFSLVTCPFNAALHLYERQDVERWLARVSDHLTPHGELVFDVSMPILEDLARDPTVAYGTPPFEHPTHGRVRYSEHFDYDRVRQILFVSMCFEPITENKIERKPRGRARARTAQRDPFMVPLAHRQFYPRELEALLHYNGFDVHAMYGDFNGGPLGQRSDVIVVHARRQKRRATRSS